MKKNWSTLLLFFLFLSQQVRAQVQSTAPGPEPTSSSDLNSRGPPWQVILVASLLFLGGYVIYLCCFIQFGNWRYWRRPWGEIAASLRQHSAKSTTNTLDRDVVKSFPTFEYGAIKSSMISKGRTLECAVCLTEYKDKDVLRFIPNCDHVFHADCVDDWLVGHATCPVCRLTLANVEFRTDHDQSDDGVLWGENGSPRMRSLSLLSSASASRRLRLFTGLRRSLSAGHVADRRWEDMERYRIPGEVREQIMRSKSERYGNGKVEGSGKLRSWVFGLTASFREELDRFEGVSASSTITSKEEGSSSIDVVSMDEPMQLPV